MTFLLFFPMLVGVVLLMVPKHVHNTIYKISLGATLAHFVILCLTLVQIDFSIDQWHYVVKVPWIEPLHIYYALGIDGLSALMCLLTSITMVLAIALSYKIKKKSKAYFILMLFLQTGIYGVFLSIDLFLFYIFWEMALIPLYFLIGIWGGVRREYAAIKFFIYTMIGSVFLLLSLVLLYLLNPTDSGILLTDLHVHQQWIRNFSELIWGIPVSTMIFLGLFIAFAIKIPIFPFHTWLPDAHVQAPTPVSVVLAGILLKLGMYGMLRFTLGFVPGEVVMFAPVIFILGVINLIYGAFCAMYQKNMKKLIAYSSISHMGYCIIGFSALTFLGLEGSIMQMLSHGLIAALLFIIAGAIYERTYTLTMSDLGGFASQLPRLTFVAVFAVFAAIGLPGLFGFVSEFMVLVGAFMGSLYPSSLFGASDTFFQLGTSVAMFTVLITAVYMLWMLQRTFFGALAEKWTSLEDISTFDLGWIVLLMVLIFVFGIQ
ncbi:MAG: NADH-quinone oxidoreductase subunit M, partial [Phycisphaerales bacterium]